MASLSSAGDISKLREYLVNTFLVFENLITTLLLKNNKGSGLITHLDSKKIRLRDNPQPSF